MSESATVIAYWKGNTESAARVDGIGSQEHQYCEKCLRKWAAHIIGEGMLNEMPTLRG